MDLVLDPSMIAGLTLATMRTAAFAMATPAYPIPTSGRLAFAVAIGFFLAAPVADLSIGALAAAGVVNVAVGAGLGWLTGLVFGLFPMAGGILDLMSGMGVSSLFDPLQGVSAALFNRVLVLTASMVFLVLGGDNLLIHGLAMSVERIPLDGSMSMHAGLLAEIGSSLGIMVVAAIELALPAIAALFLAEVVLGLGSRFAPSANLFVLGLPLRFILALVSSSAVLTLFPETMGGVMRLMREAFVAGIRAFGG